MSWMQERNLEMENKKPTTMGKKFREVGFTLIELLVAIVVLAIIVGAGIANFRRLNARKQIENSAKQVEQAVRETQKRASAGVKSPGWCDDTGDTLVGYIITLGVPTNNQYQITADCSDDSEDTTTSYSLGGRGVFDSSSSVSFDRLGRASSDSTLCFRDADSQFFYQIRITVGGSVSFSKTTSC